MIKYNNFFYAIIFIFLLVLPLAINPISAEKEKEDSSFEFYDIIIEFFTDLEIFNVTEIEHFGNIYIINSSGPIISNSKVRYYPSTHAWDFTPEKEVYITDFVSVHLGVFDVQREPDNMRCHIKGMAVGLVDTQCSNMTLNHFSPMGYGLLLLKQMIC